MPMVEGKIEDVAIIGAGTMGHRIAELAIMNKCGVRLTDVKDEYLERAVQKIRSSLQELNEKQRVREDVSAILSRLTTTTSIEEGAMDTDFVIEAVPEVLELKLEVFRKLDRITETDVVLATNTSSLPITEIAQATEKPERVIGMHYFDPILLPTTEIIRGERTSDHCASITYRLARHWKLQPVLLNKDVPGFIVNRIQARMFNIAAWMVSEGRASVTEVDATLKYELGFPLGAFELADYSGIDVLHYMLKAMKEHGFAIHICPVFEEKFKAGELGAKSGRGFYSYERTGSKPVIPQTMAKADPLSLLAPMLNEAEWLVSNDVASAADIDKAFIGLGFPKGLSEYARDFGRDKIIERLEWLEERTGWEELRPERHLGDLIEATK